MKEDYLSDNVSGRTRSTTNTSKYSLKKYAITVGNLVLLLCFPLTLVVIIICKVAIYNEFFTY